MMKIKKGHVKFTGMWLKKIAMNKDGEKKTILGDLRTREVIVPKRILRIEKLVGSLNSPTAMVQAMKLESIYEISHSEYNRLAKILLDEQLVEQEKTECTKINNVLEYIEI